MSLEFPPPVPDGFIPGLRKGRIPKEGYERSWHLGGPHLPETIRAEPSFQRAHQLAVGRTVVDDSKLLNLYLLVRFYLPRLAPGHIVEFGSYRGGSALFMAAVAEEFLPEARIYALDTFAGMPTTDKSIDLHTEGDFKDVSLEEVQAAVVASGLKNLILVPGLFADTAARVAEEAKAVSLVHMDCDIYPALVEAWSAARDFLVRGAYVAFDDATVGSCLGATEMVEEIMIRREGLCSEQIWPHFVFRYPPPHPPSMWSRS